MDALISRIEKTFSNKKIRPTEELLAYAKACDEFAMHKLTDDELQSALCEYLDMSALRIRALSEVLDRAKEPALSEIVTESINMLVDSFIRKMGLCEEGFSVSSEKNVRLSSGIYRKPDVGIWKNDKLKLIIECKTSLGRRRKEWQDDFEKRVVEFSSVGLPATSVMLFVGTDTTWKGFPSGDKRINETWFSLCPVGTWYGGGKAGETTMSSKQHSNVVKKFKTAIFSSIVEKSEFM
jgi:hypothetical protein